jgi:putative peptidoglycan lipid II flippase
MGFLRDAAIAGVYGAGAATDAYAVASRIVATAGLLVSTYLTTTFVPAYARVREERGEEAALKFTNDVAGVSLAVNVLLMAVLQIASPALLKITGFDPGQSSMALTAVRISLFQLPISVFASLFAGYLTARKSFLGQSLVSFPFDIAVIAACFAMGTESGVAGLSAANLIGMAVKLAALALWLPKEKYRYRFSLGFKTPEIRGTLALLVPALLGSAAAELNAWVDTVIATHLGQGSAAAIGFASRLPSFALGLTIAPISGITLSYMSEYAAKKESGKMLGAMWRAMRLGLFAVVPVTAIAVPSSLDIVRIVYQRGQFTADAALMTGQALVGYLLSMAGTAAYSFILRFSYALSDTKTPMFCGLAAVAANIALSLALSGPLGIAGITFATAASGILATFLLLAALRRKIGPLGFRETAWDILKMLAGAVPCLLAVFGARHALSGHMPLVRFAACTCAGGAAYLVATFFLKEKALMELLAMAREWLAARRKGE